MMQICVQGKLDRIISKGHDRLSNMLVLIVEGEGRKELVLTKRGKKFRALDLPKVGAPTIPQRNTIS